MLRINARHDRECLRDLWLRPDLGHEALVPVEDARVIEVHEIRARGDGLVARMVEPLRRDGAEPDAARGAVRPEEVDLIGRLLRPRGGARLDREIDALRSG